MKRFWCQNGNSLGIVIFLVTLSEWKLIWSKYFKILASKLESNPFIHPSVGDARQWCKTIIFVWNISNIVRLWRWWCNYKTISSLKKVKKRRIHQFSIRKCIQHIARIPIWRTELIEKVINTKNEQNWTAELTTLVCSSHHHHGLRFPSLSSARTNGHKTMKSGRSVGWLALLCELHIYPEVLSCVSIALRTSIQLQAGISLFFNPFFSVLFS